MKICILCEKEVDPASSFKVKDDPIIMFLRNVKSKLKIVKNNELYVCNSDLEKYNKKRKSFERNLIICSAIAAIVFLLFLVVTILSFKFDLLAFFSVFIILIFILALPILVYAPAIEVKNNGSN